MEVKVLFTTSKRIHPKFGILTIGKYTIEPISSTSVDASKATNKYLLRFDDVMKDDEPRSPQPTEEARLFLAWLAVLLETQLEIESCLLSSAPVPTRQDEQVYSYFRSVTEELPDLEALLEKIRSMDEDVATQFIRACEVYQTAVNLLETNITLSFFLLTVSIECLSNKVGEGDGTCEKFIDFILTYLPNQDDFETEEDWKEILKEIYYNHRSGFVHGGKQIPNAVSVADQLGRKYIRNVIGDKEVRTPGLKWFERIVRDCLIGFLDSTELQETNNQKDHFKDLSLEYGIVKLKTKKAMQAPRPVIISDEDFYLD